MADTALDARLARLLKKLEPEVRTAFMDAIRKAKGAVNQAELIRALEQFEVTRDIQPVLDALRLDANTLFPLTEAVRNSYLAAGQSVGEILPIRIRAQFGFGGNPGAVAAAQSIVGDLVENITREHVETTRRIVSEAVNEGIPPRVLAQQITGTRVGNRREGGYLGLSSDLVDPIIRGRSKLLSGEPKLMREYMRLELRDKREDRVIERAIAEGRALTRAEVDRIIEAHKAKALGYRGRRIARTETLNALRKGNHDGFGALADQGYQVEKTWKVTRDGRERESHGLLGGTTLPFDQPFISPATGALMDFPGDGSQGARGVDTVQCRCAAVYRVKRRRRNGSG